MKLVVCAFVGMFFCSISGQLAASENGAVLATKSEEVSSSERSSYIGFDLFSGESKINRDLGSSSSSATFDRSGFRALLGARRDAGVRFEAFIELEDYDAFDNGIFSVGGNLKKAFGSEQGIRPFVKIGAMFGSTELEDTALIDYEEESLANITLLCGLGMEKKLNDSVEAHMGIDIGTRVWQDIEYINGGGTIVLEQDDTPVSFYLGLNFDI